MSSVPRPNALNCFRSAISPPHPVQQRGGLAELGLDVDRLVAVDRVHDRRRVEPGEVGPREARIAVAGPLHRGADAIAVAKVDVVAHADLVAVIDHGRAGKREEQTVQELDPGPAVADQRGQTAANPQVEPHPRVGGVLAVHVVALFLGDHLERQFVVVAEEDRPLALGRDLGRLAHDLDDRVPVLLAQRHEDAWHQREVKRHVAFVAVAEVRQHVGRPLVGLGQKHPVAVVGVELAADLLDDRVALGEVLAVRPLALDQIRDRIEPHAVDTHVEPEPHHLANGAKHLRGCRSSGRADGGRTGASNTPAPPGPRSSSRSRCR